MKSTFKLIKRFTKALIFSVIILFVLNVVLLFSVTYTSLSNAGGWSAADELSKALILSPDGVYTLSESGKEILKERNAWAILIEDKTGNVIWHSDNLPEEIPMHYSAAEISYYTRGYIEDYPTTTASMGDNLVIMGHPKNMYWKHMTPTFDYQMISNIPKYLLLFSGLNIFVIFLIYFISTSGVLRSVKPIVNGIEELPEGRDVYIKEKGLLSDLAKAINRVSEKLMRQERELRKKEEARANWISCVSHDIRTPLSMVMGYAGQLMEDESLSKENRKKVTVISEQSEKMKNLINDLNLASKLEYNMQPLNPKDVSLVAAARQCVANFIDSDDECKYPVEWKIFDNISPCIIKGDKNLICRAINNVINNSRCHNPDGCNISVEVKEKENEYMIVIEDDGVGVTDEQLTKLRNTPHYMLSDGGTTQLRHGLGLLIVQQVAEVHNGKVCFDHGEKGGFLVTLLFRKTK